MNLVCRINKYFRGKKEKKFWDWPDEWTAAIILYENIGTVGKVKKGLALIETFPDPMSGYHYNDVLEIEGPIGKQPWREGEINVYKVKGIRKKSNYKLFIFQAIFPESKDHFYVLAEFDKQNQHATYPWHWENNIFEWRQGMCTAESIEHAREILTGFCAKDERRKLGLIEDELTYLTRMRNDGISNENGVNPNVK